MSVQSTLGRIDTFLAQMKTTIKAHKQDAATQAQKAAQKKTDADNAFSLQKQRHGEADALRQQASAKQKEAAAKQQEAQRLKQEGQVAESEAQDLGTKAEQKKQLAQAKKEAQAKAEGEAKALAEQKAARLKEAAAEDDQARDLEQKAREARDRAKTLDEEKQNQALKEAQGFDGQKDEHRKKAAELKKVAEALSQKADVATGRAQALLQEGRDAGDEEARLRKDATARMNEATQKKKAAQTAEAQAQTLNQEAQQLAHTADQKDADAEQARQLGEVLRTEQTQAARDKLSSLLAEAIARVEQVRAKLPDVLQAQPEHAIDQGQAKTDLLNAVATAPLDQVDALEATIRSHLSWAKTQRRDLRANEVKGQWDKVAAAARGELQAAAPLLAVAQRTYRFTGVLKTPTDRMAGIASQLTQDAQTLNGLLAKEAQDPLAKGLRGDHLTKAELTRVSQWLQDGEIAVTTMAAIREKMAVTAARMVEMEKLVPDDAYRLQSTTVKTRKSERQKQKASAADSKAKREQAEGLAKKCSEEADELRRRGEDNQKAEAQKRQEAAGHQNQCDAASEASRNLAEQADGKRREADGKKAGRAERLQEADRLDKEKAACLEEAARKRQEAEQLEQQAKAADEAAQKNPEVANAKKAAAAEARAAARKLTEAAEGLDALAGQHGQAAAAGRQEAEKLLQESQAAESEEAKLRQEAAAKAEEASQLQAKAEQAGKEADALRLEADKFAEDLAAKDQETDQARQLAKKHQLAQENAEKEALVELFNEVAARLKQIRDRNPAAFTGEAGTYDIDVKLQWYIKQAGQAKPEGLAKAEKRLNEVLAWAKQQRKSIRAGDVKGVWDKAEAALAEEQKECESLREAASAKHKFGGVLQKTTSQIKAIAEKARDWVADLTKLSKEALPPALSRALQGEHLSEDESQAVATFLDQRLAAVEKVRLSRRPESAKAKKLLDKYDRAPAAEKKQWVQVLIDAVNSGLKGATAKQLATQHGTAGLPTSVWQKLVREKRAEQLRNSLYTGEQWAMHFGLKKGDGSAYIRHVVSVAAAGAVRPVHVTIYPAGKSASLGQSRDSIVDAILGTMGRLGTFHATLELLPQPYPHVYRGGEEDRYSCSLAQWNATVRAHLVAQLTSEVARIGGLVDDVLRQGMMNANEDKEKKSALGSLKNQL